jgi:hypothetical protein
MTGTAKPGEEPEYRMRACRRCGRIRPARPESTHCEDCIEVLAHENDPEDLFDDEVLDQLWKREP